MPPVGFRKRERSASPLPTPPSKKPAVAKPAAKRGKQTLFDAADEPQRKPGSAEKAKRILKNLEDDDDSESEVDSDDFEDVPPAKRQKTTTDGKDDGKSDEESDDGMDWEDVAQQQASASIAPSDVADEEEIGDISISMKEDGSYIQPEIGASSAKKGPSKRERHIRIQTHCLHVQALMWHNTVRNSWLNDAEVQKTLADGLTDGVKKEVTRYREAMGTLTREELEAKKTAAAAKNKGKGKRGRKGKDTLAGRDWSYNAEHLEQGVVDLSRGDPLLRLLKILTAYWRKRFLVTTPGLRKQGYKPLRRLRDEIQAWDKDPWDAEEHGERIETRESFRKAAKECEGSRDLGAQLFVALLRGLGLETRMVTNIQPAGFGWSKSEEAAPKKAKSKEKTPARAASESEDDVKLKPKRGTPTYKGKGAVKVNGTKKTVKDEKPTRKSSRGNKGEPINLDDSDSPLSSAPSDNEEPDDDDDAAGAGGSDDMSVVDVTPAPRKRPAKKYDRDLAFPIYWAEVMSPATNKYIPVDPVVLSTIASNEELLQSFEPRGKRAENAKQVMCYTVGFSSDGTAKDVTVRYLKRHQLPGKTKGMRMPAEKIPIYNRKGKVKRYEEYDWFRTLMSIYDRPEKKRTAADDLEEQTDLKPFKASKEMKEVEKESLQWYKQSAEFVLEQHLRREEAIKPGAEPVKTFTAGKGDKAKEHPVFRRDDVLVCKTVESWHKEGRALKNGEHPVKHVPMRAVTLVRKREMEDALRETGEKLQQGLYSREQTDWIIPPPISNGIIPKNAFGNMDVYVPTMVPKGAIHLPLKGSAKLCKRMQIDFAEACTGFEFGKQRAVPVLTGVVVAKENEGMVRDAWRTEQAEQKRKEDTKRTGVALHWWRKMLMGLRIVERMQQDYAANGQKVEDVNPFVNKALREGRPGSAAAPVVAGDDDDMEGGFFRPGHDEEEVPHRSYAPADDEGGGFVVDDGNDADEHTGGDGGFLLDGEDDGAEPAVAKTNGHSAVKPTSLQAMHNVANEDDMSDAGSEPVERPKPTPQKVTARKSKPKPTPKSRGRPKRKMATPSASDPSLASEAEDSLCDLSDVSSDIGAGRPRTSSPQVVITPRKVTPASKARAKRKTTPLKSPYFSSQGVDEGDEENPSGDDDDEDEETEAEVVKPRGTTARTRNKGR